MLSESKECIVPNELSRNLSPIDMNNQNHRKFDYDDDEPHHVKLDMEERDVHHRRNPAPLSESTLNLFACIIAAAIATFALVGLAIALIVLAFK